MSNKLDVSLLNNSSVKISSSLFDAISICGIFIGVGATIEGFGGFGINCTFCPLLLDGVGGVAQTEFNVVVDGVVEDTEFCLRGGPNGGKSSWGSFGLEVVVDTVSGAIRGTILLVCDIIGGAFPPVGDAPFFNGVLCVLVVVVLDDDDDDPGNGVIAFTTFGSVDDSIGASVDFFEK